MPASHPSAWGPGLWKFIHTSSQNLPNALQDDHKEAIRQLLSSLLYLLPCEMCRNHYRQWYSEHVSCQLETKAQVIALFVDLHNSVNVRNGKAVFDVRNHSRLYS